MSQPLSLFAQKTSQTQLNCFDQKKKNTAELHGAIPQAFLMQTCTTNNATLDTDQIKLKKIKHVTYCTVFCHTYSCVIKTNPEGAPRHVLHTCLLIIFSCQISLFFYFLPMIHGHWTGMYGIHFKYFELFKRLHKFECSPS